MWVRKYLFRSLVLNDHLPFSRSPLLSALHPATFRAPLQHRRAGRVATSQVTLLMTVRSGGRTSHSAAISESARGPSKANSGPERDQSSPDSDHGRPCSVSVSGARPGCTQAGVAGRRGGSGRRRRGGGRGDGEGSCRGRQLVDVT